MSSTPSAPASTTNHDERLTVPVLWWVVSLFLAMTFVVAVWAILSDLWALGTLALFTTIVVVFLVVYGSARITADDRGLQAGGATIAWQWVGGATALDAARSRLVLNAAADGRTWLLLRPFLKSYVRVDLVDPADQHRHWLLASRDPKHLAEAINSHVNALGASAVVAPTEVSHA